jgi:sec-independent protein translocase protein TatC
MAAPGEKREMAHMSLVEHLRELRKRLVYSLIAVSIGFGVAYEYADDIFKFLVQPLLTAMPAGQEKRLIYTGLAQPFMLDLKVGVFGGIVLALPFILWQIWLFVAPALYKHERRYVIPAVTSAMLMFTAGAAFCYYVAFPVGFAYFLSYTTEYVQPFISIDEYLDFATKMLLGFGAMFELPLVILLLARMGIVSPQFLNKNRRWAILVISVLAAVFTPPDALSMAIMGVPLYALYEISVLLAYLVYKKKPSLVDENGEFTGKGEPQA